MFPALCEALGLNPATTTVVPFTVVNKTVAYAVEDIVMKALIDLGMDFWWIDYQQGGTQGNFCYLPQSSYQLINNSIRQAAAPAWRRIRRCGPTSCVSPTQSAKVRTSAG